MTAPLLILQDVTKGYGSGRATAEAEAEADHLAVDHVTLTVAPGRTTGLVGESGSGKSTLARLALGLLAPDTGTVRFDGRDPHRLRGRSARAVRAGLQFVPQHPGRSLNPALRAGAAVSFALAAHGTPRAERTDAVATLFQQVGLEPALARRYPRELSGGQLQRIAVARALATRPRLIVCDEPTSALDRLSQTRLLDLLLRLQAEDSLSYLFISHDLAVVRQIADHVTVLRTGRVVEEGAAADIWTAPRHPYTRALLAAAEQSPSPSGPVSGSVLAEPSSASSDRPSSDTPSSDRPSSSRPSSSRPSADKPSEENVS